MPEAGRTPAAAFEKGDALAQGEAAELNSLAGLIGPVDEDDGFQPSGEDESFLFSPSDRPTEPITAGAAFGPGAQMSRFAYRDEETEVRRVASEIDRDPQAPANLKAFARRVMQGQ